MTTTITNTIHIAIPPVTNVKWGDVIWVDMPKDTHGSEQGGIRPAVVIQNDKGNEASPTTIVAFITSRNKKYMPTHITIYPQDSGLDKISTVMCEQIRTIDKSRIISKVGHLNAEWLIEKIRKSIQISFGIT